MWCWSPTDGESSVGFPQAVPLAEPVTQVSVGTRHACALGDSGIAYCWGQSGPWLGHGGTGATPSPVATSQRFTMLAAGGTHTCGLVSGDRVFCWGVNEYGQLGDGTRDPSSRPVMVRF